MYCVRTQHQNKSKNYFLSEQINASIFCIVAAKRVEKRNYRNIKQLFLSNINYMN